MNRELPPRIGELLDDAGRRVGVKAPVETGKLWARWREIVGPDVAAHARPSSLRDGVLRVRADSPAWATEIGYLGDEIRRRANDVAAREIVTEVRVWTGPPRGDAAETGPSGTSDFEPPSETRREPTTDDPAVAMERARSAWARRSKGRFAARSTSPEIKRKSW
jgi:Dna[CI] antecedent DciA-like protein